MKCVKCEEATACENMIICSGLCKNVAHYKCVGLRKAAFELICGNDNVFWFCDSCKFCYNLQVKKLSELSDISKNIEMSVQLITEKISVDRSNIRADVKDDSEASKFSTIQTPADENKLMTDTGSLVLENTNAKPKGTLTDESSISSFTQSSPTTTKTYAEVVSCPREVIVPSKLVPPAICGTKHFPKTFGVKTFVPMLWLHLSKFDPGTTENDISLMTKTCLEIENCKVFQLVPKNRKPESLEYACFKLGVNAEL